jgi:hypothetical protein
MNGDDAISGKDSRSGIDDLIASYADPIIKKIILQKMGLYSNSAWKSIIRYESEDLYQTVLMKLVGVLGSKHPSFLDQNPDEIKRYVATVAYNVCNDFIRERYPERHRLKDKLRDLLKRHPDFSYWYIADRLLCGFSNWIGRTESSKVATLICYLDENGIVTELEGLNVKDLVGFRFSKLIAELFCWFDGPIEIEHLVYITAKLQGVRDEPIESIDNEDFPVWKIADYTNTCYERVEVRELLHRFWGGICTLPLTQRKTILITCFDHTGESLLHSLIYEKIVAISQIYQVLAMTREELISIWDKLPMDTSTAALELGTNNRMIAKWRHRALKKLAAICGIEKT